MTAERRAMILYLYHGEGLSAVVVAELMALSLFAVRRVVHASRRTEVPETGRAAPMAFSDESKGGAS